MHKNRFDIVLRFILSGFLLCNFLGCGKGFKDDDKIQEEVWQGQYGTQFRPLNQRLGSSSGWAKISIYENQIWARVKFHGNKTKDMHAQYIHANGHCPSMKDDTNGDGYLDFMEVYEVAGPIILPLDSNLNSQLKGIFEFPAMKRQPFYYYSEASNFSRTMHDLRAHDVVLDDMISKLHGEELDLQRRVVLIYGVDIDVILPGSVRSFTGFPAQATLPVACGELNFDDHEPYED